MGFFSFCKKFFPKKRKGTTPTSDEKDLLIPVPPEYSEKDASMTLAESEDARNFTDMFNMFLGIWGKPPNPHLLANRWDILMALPGIGEVPEIPYHKRVTFFITVLVQIKKGKEITRTYVRQLLEC